MIPHTIYKKLITYFPPLVYEYFEITKYTEEHDLLLCQISRVTFVTITKLADIDT